MTTDKYIPVYAYAKKMNTSVQNVYRWIREHRLDSEDIQEVEVIVKRLKVKENSTPKLRK